MKSRLNRREFLETTAAASAFAIVPSRVLGGKGRIAPSDKITLAHIGFGSQSIREVESLLQEPQLQIVSICDPNTDSSNYIEWGKNNIKSRVQRILNNPNWREYESGCPGGREVGKEIVNTWYANNRGSTSFKGCSMYADFREMLEKEKDIDAVKIMTPDHLHATLSTATMKKGIHTIMHKPVANRMYEGRKVVDMANQTDVVTHLLAYGSGADNGRIVEKIKQGVIGPLREIHNWTNRPVWPQYAQVPTDTPPIPDGFDWDLWLGPSEYRAYHPQYTHTVYRGWYEFGGGSMADMGIYSLWPVFAGLDLKPAKSAHAWATHACTIVDNTSVTIENDFSYPSACRLRFEFEKTKNTPELELFWYDGGMKPRFPKEIEDYGIELDREGIMFIGDNGAIFAEFRGSNPKLLANGKIKELDIREPEQRDNEGERRRLRWLDAVLNNQQSEGSFQNAASITDTVNLGTVALRAGKKVEFDSDKMQISNDSNADQYLYRDYRKGWEL